MEGFCFNRAVMFFGKTVENDLHDISEGKKPAEARGAIEVRLSQWLQQEPKFADPAKM